MASEFGPRMTSIISQYKAGMGFYERVRMGAKKSGGVHFFEPDMWAMKARGRRRRGE